MAHVTSCACGEVFDHKVLDRCPACGRRSPEHLDRMRSRNSANSRGCSGTSSGTSCTVDCCGRWSARYSSAVNSSLIADVGFLALR
jgi:hypothetical protein